MHEAGARSLGGTMPPSNPLPAFVPLDVIDQLRALMAREREETIAALQAHLDAFGKLAEMRDRNLRDELLWIKHEMDFDQD